MRPLPLAPPSGCSLASSTADYDWASLPANDLPPAAALLPPEKVRQVSYTKVGTHRGLPRLWLEGMRLAKAGFEKDARFSVIYDRDQHTIILQVSEDGDRTVSGRKRRGSETVTPIIDFASQELSEILQDAGRVRAVISNGCIVFSLHHQDKTRYEREQRLTEELAEGELSEATLCAGIGVSTMALAEGLATAGIESRVEWVVDREGRYLEVANRNNPAISSDTQLFVASLEELEPKLLPQVSLLSVSLPCTGHSPAGKAKRGLKRAEQHPTDALAVLGLIRILDAVQPSIIISENVPAAAGSATYDLVRAYLADSGYVLHERVLDGDDAGSLEDRKRWWFVAISEGIAEGFDVETLPPQVKRYRCLGAALDALPDDDPRWGKNDYLDAKEVRDRAAGKGFRRQFVDETSSRVPTIRRAYLKRGSSDPFVRRADGMERLLTPAEHARAKGVDERLVAGTTLQTAHEGLGQSILAGHGRAIGEAVGRHIACRARPSGAAPPDEQQQQESEPSIQQPERSSAPKM